MADTDLKPRGVVNPKGTSWLKEVKVDAARNTVEHLRRQKEAQEFAQLKARGVTPEEIIEKGREDLARPEAEPVSHKHQDESEEVAKLKAELKAKRTKNTRLESKLKKGSEPDGDEEETK